jgi:hypothetical protein
MPITSAQLSSALRVKKEFNLVNGDLDLTDLTNFAGLGVIAPNTWATLVKIVDPTGAIIYQNAGFDTDNYTSPDFNNATTTLDDAIPTDVLGNYITGTYTIYLKCKVVQGADTIYGSATTTSFVCGCTTVISIDVDVDYATAVATTTDTTNYGAYFSLTRSHTIYPPPISGLPNQTTSATTNVYSNIVTTTWSVQIESTIVTLKANDTYITCEVSGSKEFLVEADTLCKTLCVLKTYRADLFKKFGKVNTVEMERAWSLAMDEYVLAIQATRCGRPQSEVQGYIDKAYAILGIDPSCDCGCSASDNPTPVVPTSIVNGTDGTDGVTPTFQNTGTWIQVSYNNGSTWTNLFSLASVTGATGAAGANGLDGASGAIVLHNDITNSTTVTNALELLANKTYQLPAGTLSNNGDILKIRARFTTSPEVGVNIKECYVYFGGSAVSIFSAFTRNQTLSEIEMYITRTGATSGKIDGYSTLSVTNAPPLLWMSPYNQVQKWNFPIETIAPTWSGALDIQIYADDNGNNPITCELFQVEVVKYGTQVSASAAIFYGVPFTTTNAVQTYPNVIGSFGKTIRRVYLDGELLDTADWTYNNTTDILTFVLAISGASEVQIDYQ